MDIFFYLNDLYIDSWISYDLNDEYDIKGRIQKANNEIGAQHLFLERSRSRYSY